MDCYNVFHGPNQPELPTESLLTNACAFSPGPTVRRADLLGINLDSLVYVAPMYPTHFHSKGGSDGRLDSVKP